MEGDPPRTKFAGVIGKKPSEVSGRTFRTRFSNSLGRKRLSFRISCLYP
jgi:hypothetical protein